MRLTTAQSIGSKNTTADEIRHAFRDDKGRGEFIVLDDGDQFFIQAAGDWGEPFVLEFRDGDKDHHFRAEGKWPKDDVERVFLWYFEGDPRWKTEFPWRPIERKPWWKFW
jgi:hypothetical protein